jgi:hypothetical protein
VVGTHNDALQQMGELASQIGADEQVSGGIQQISAGVIHLSANPLDRLHTAEHRQTESNTHSKDI